MKFDFRQDGNESGAQVCTMLDDFEKKACKEFRDTCCAATPSIEESKQYVENLGHLPEAKKPCEFLV